MIVSVIAAMGSNGVIGDDAGLPWHMPRDLKRFRDFTRGKPVIMGRRTAQLIGRPLPDRFNILLTHNPAYTAAGFQVVHSLKESLSAAHDYLVRSGGEEVMVIGGSKVYGEFVHLCDRLYLTVINGRFSGTAHFPQVQFCKPDWHVVDWELCSPDERNPHAHKFYLIEREKARSHLTRTVGGGSQPIPAAVLFEILEGWRFLAEHPTPHARTHDSVQQNR